MEASTPTDPRRWLALTVLVLAACMNLIDVTIVNIGIPVIRDGLHASSSQIEWIVAAYALVFALGLVTGGRLGDIYGRRRAFVVGIVGFTSASVLCGIAGNADVLVAGRAAQGAFAAIMVPQVIATIQVLFDGTERAKAFGIWGAMLGLATVGSPLLGAVLVQGDLFGLDWRPLFLVNVPVGLIAIAGALAYVPESRSERPLRPDLVGVGLLTVALLALMYPLVQGQSLDWPAWCFVSMAAAIPAFALFAYHQARKGEDGSPLVPLGLFRERGFTGGVLLGLVFFSGIVGFSLVLVLTLQVGLGWTPVHAALTVLPFAFTIALASGFSIPLVARLGRLLILAATVTMLVGSAAVLVAVKATGPDLDTLALLPGMLICGLALGMIAPTLVNVALAEVPARDAGAASGIVSSSNQVGSAIGVAAMGAIFFALLPDGVPKDPATAYTSALGNAIWFDIAVFAVSIGLVFLLPSRPPRTAEEDSAAPPEPEPALATATPTAGAGQPAETTS